MVLTAKKKKTNAKRSVSVENDDDGDDGDDGDVSMYLEQGVEAAREEREGEVVDDVPEDKGDRSVNLPEQNKKEIVNNIIRAIVQENNAALRKVIYENCELISFPFI